MEISFRTRRLERCFADVDEAVKAWGPLVGRAYIKAGVRLEDAVTWQDARAMRGWQLHPLRGEHKGLWSATLHGRWRLILSRAGDTVRIEEVSNHYGD